MAAGALLLSALIAMPTLAPAAGDDDELLNALTKSPGRPQPMLRVEWEAVPSRAGRARLAGSVHNDYGRAARDVQLRVSELDAAGEVVATVDGPTLSRVPGQGEARFDVAVPDTGHHYRVVVAAFSLDFAAPAIR
jgi:hypothetical protein